MPEGDLAKILSAYNFIDLYISNDPLAPIMGRGSFQFGGDGGNVTINIIDNRLNPVEEGFACTRRREVYASISYPSAEVIRIANSAGLMASDPISRGRVLARLVEDSSGSLNALRHCQRSLENIPGALVAMALTPETLSPT